MGLALVPKDKIKPSIMYLCTFYAKNRDVLDKSGCCREEDHFGKQFKEYSKQKVKE